MCNSTWQQFSHAIGQPELEAASVLPEGWCVRPAPCVGRGPGNGTAALECLMPLLLHPTEPLRMHLFIDEHFIEASVNNQSIIMVSSLSGSSANRLLGPVGAARVDSWVLDK